MPEKKIDDATQADFEEMEREHKQFMKKYWRQRCRETGWPIELIESEDEQ